MPVLRSDIKQTALRSGRRLMQKLSSNSDLRARKQQHAATAAAQQQQQQEVAGAQHTCAAAAQQQQQETAGAQHACAQLAAQQQQQQQETAGAQHACAQLAVHAAADQQQQQQETAGAQHACAAALQHAAHAAGAAGAGGDTEDENNWHTPHYSNLYTEHARKLHQHLLRILQNEAAIVLHLLTPQQAQQEIDAIAHPESYAATQDDDLTWTLFGGNALLERRYLNGLVHMSRGRVQLRAPFFQTWTPVDPAILRLLTLRVLSHGDDFDRGEYYRLLQRSSWTPSSPGYTPSGSDFTAP